MTADFRQLAQEISELTGSEPPPLLDADSPTLSPDALDHSAAEPYLISLIGGKDVGKSSLVNAIAGREITPASSHGAGTESVIAYVHESQTPWVRRLLESEAAGQHRLVPHPSPHLSRQVLLDLPDIDSHYAHHIELTRRMLRHTLYPVFLQSVEKYADHRPRELLALVATGNNPENFIFALNKADQLIAREGADAAQELAADYAQRLQRTLGLQETPRVWLISAIHPDRYDLPALRKLLSQQRTEGSVAASIQLASYRQGLSLADWIERQHLDQRLAAMQRLQAAAEDELSSRVSLPLIQSAVPKILEDPAYRLALADSLMDQRVTRWPIVNIFHVLLSPLLSLMRRRLPLPQQTALQGPGEMVNLHLQAVPSLQHASAALVPGSTALDTTRPLAHRIQSTFALLHQSSPTLSKLYPENKLWESLPATLAEADLRQRLASTIERQRSLLRSEFASSNPFAALFRWTLTIGALLWFPLIQPLLALGVTQEWGVILYRLVTIFSATTLLKNLSFLALYYTFLWLALRYATQRRVDRFLSRLLRSDRLDPALSLTAQVAEWTDALLSPIRLATNRLADLVSRFEHLRQSLTSGKAA